MTNPIIETFARASLEDAKRMIRMGFELETQSCNGDASSDDSGPCDECIRFAEESWVNSASQDDGEFTSWWNARDVLRRVPSLLDEVYTYVHYNLERYEIDTLPDDADDAAIEAYDRSISDTVSNVLDDFDLNDLRRITSPSTDYAIREMFKNYLEEIVSAQDLDYDCSCNVGDRGADLPSGLSSQKDGSVSGPEIVTEGPNTYADCMRLMQAFADRNTWESDVRCSFHVHVSLPGVKHTYGCLMQRHMSLFLLTTAAEEGHDFLLNRWGMKHRNGITRYFFQIIEQNTKYTFVNYHDGYGTWELRALGNVNTVDEAEICLDLAVRALQHAYRVRLGLEDPIGDLQLDNNLADEWIGLTKAQFKERVRLLDVFNQSQAA